MKNHFATNLKLKRLSFGWSQEKVATEISNRAGIRVDKTTYQSWEAGRRSPKLKALVTIVEIFCIDDLYLFISKSN